MSHTRTYIKSGLLFLFLLFLPILLFAEGEAESADDISSSTIYAAYAGQKSIIPSLFASTEEVAAIVTFATDYPVTVPSVTVKEGAPSFTPDDISAAKEADMVFWEGSENFMAQLVTAEGIQEKNIRTIQTELTPLSLKENVDRLAAFFGTQDIASERMDTIEILFDQMRSAVSELSKDERTVIVHYSHQAFAEAIGFTVAAVIGPAAPPEEEIESISSLEFSLIIDDAHAPLTLPFVNDSSRYVKLESFHDSLITLITGNGALLGILD